MATLLLLGRLWRQTLPLHILLLTLGYSASVPSRQARRLFDETAVDLESIAVGGRNKRSDEESSDSNSGVLACSDPGVPPNGSRSGNEFYVGQELLFACESGFVLRGSEVLTCQSDDINSNGPRWDGELPQCVGKKSNWCMHSLRSCCALSN